MTDDKALQKLIEDVRESVEYSIDDLHAAAILESTGLTDERARTVHERADAFELAAQVRAFVGTDWQHPVEAEPDAQPQVDGVGRRIVGHGLLYAALALSVAGLLGLVPMQSLPAAVVAGGAIGWVWAALTAWVSFTLAGRGAVREARRFTLFSATCCLLATAAGAAAAVGTDALPTSGATVVFALVCIQVGATMLFLARQRQWLLVALTPGAAAGIIALAADISSRTDDLDISRTVLVFLLVSIAGLLVLAFLAIATAPGSSTPSNVDGVFHPAVVLPIVLYAVLCAAFLLMPQGRLLQHGGDRVLGMAGLIVVMGVVEWRALALSNQARALLRHTTFTTNFRRELTRLMAREVFAVMAACALVNVGVGTLLHWWGHLVPEGRWLLAITVPLAASYLLVLAAANTTAYRPLNTVLFVGCVVQVVLLGVVDASAPLALAAGTAVLSVATPGVLLTRPVRNFA